jgi:hypothetical protein
MHVAAPTKITQESKSFCRDAQILPEIICLPKSKRCAIRNVREILLIIQLLSIYNIVSNQLHTSKFMNS